ncbi:hypothetical protein [Paraburkholderia phenazinium]|uniref:DUF551 domain-containing protein n=1 Tax=Paraburkholderia phenazinium TaxID=60549 RepID=A0A1N6KPK4_9BURK|nr:hypothetical protein [Paraburkholderia phenazinium]SIO58297.1 hypothetical protein SAMN05444165_4092 [Paraburkholderia phenazinium]
MSIDYDGVVSICDAHGIGLPVDCVEMVVEIVRHATAQPDHSGYGGVKVSAQGIQFGNAWYSHEKITGYSAEQLNDGNCHITGRAYMEWVQAALASNKAAAIAVGEPVQTIRFDFINSDGREDSKVISHDEMRERYAAMYKSAHSIFPPAPVASAEEAVTPVERGVIEDLLALTSAVFQALDNSEEREGDDWRAHVIDAPWFDPMCEAMDKLEALPDDQPGYTMDAPAKAEWALRKLFDTHPAAAQPSRAEVLETWQPIETAPKTGRTLLLGYPNVLGKWRTVRGQWISEAHIAENWEEPDDAEAGWYETSAEADDVPNCWPITPTHWMPLPPAPEVNP